ncbi:tetranectin-like [Gouania willdenowi]|uniref:Tetranectin-like n=1 Tax=Gouania willdenowi TaxID=441366 RepID=A0A8C5GCP0_GOUWI|nr:tetranectin-like [Gouania willdenowi]
MEMRGACVLLGVLLLTGCSSSQNLTKKKPLKKDATKAPNPAIEALQKQIDDIFQELNHLKEQQALQTVCLKGTKINGKCFLADPLSKQYHTASEDCNSLGGVLSAPTSMEENQQLRDYVRQSIGPDQDIWLGINDMMTEGAWVDQTGLSAAYKNWDISDSRFPQPDGGQAQNCGVLSLSAQGKWFDENCRKSKPSVCQFNIV